DRHLRALDRLLRRVLSAGATRPQAHQRGLRARVPRRRSDRRSHDADARIPARPEDQRSDPDVSERHLHDRCEPRGPPGAVDTVRHRRRPAGGPAAGRAAARRSAASENRALVSEGDRLAPARSAGVRVRNDGMDWEVVIGLEIHTQLATASKIFSGASTEYGAPPNTQACLVDLGYPGVLPVLNGQAVAKGVQFGLRSEE